MLNREVLSLFELWPTTFEQGVFGYVEVPKELTMTFIEKARAEGFVVLEITDRNGDVASRTFIFDGYDETYAKLPDNVRILPPPDESGLYEITFNVSPINASVVVYEEFCLIGLSCNRTEVGRGSGETFKLMLSDNVPEINYVYVSNLRDYVQKQKSFDVPQTLTIDIEMNEPRGLLGWLVRGGHMSTKIYGENWPFTVDQGTLKCFSDRKAAFETLSEGTYALNEAAEDDYPTIGRLIEPGIYDDYAAGKIDIAWLTDRALSFCK